jgi:hypothetical protein
MRQASVLVADDLTYSLNGKMNAIGIYTSDIVIPTSPAFVTQLIFVFIIETSPSDQFKELHLHVALPSGQFSQTTIDLNTLIHALSDDTRWNLRWPLAFYGPVLTPGPIVAKVIHEQGEIITAAPVIRMVTPVSPPST